LGGEDDDLARRQVAPWRAATDGMVGGCCGVDQAMPRAVVLAWVALVVAVGCRSTPPPEPPRARDGVAPAPVPAPAQPSPTETSIAFREASGGILQWDFDTRGLPAVDASTGTLVVADVSHGNIASYLSLSLRWLRSDQKEPLRNLTILDAGESSHVLYDIDEKDEPGETKKLAEAVSARTEEANRILSTMRLSPMVGCTIQSPDAGYACAHPQRLTCGSVTLELRNDRLSWRNGTQGGMTHLHWRIAPMQIGDGPPKEMVTCIHEAHLDTSGMRLAARIEQSCKGGGGDACFLPDEWRAVVIR
jgi:hypothetical protein